MSLRSLGQEDMPDRRLNTRKCASSEPDTGVEARALEGPWKGVRTWHTKTRVLTPKSRVRWWFHSFHSDFCF